jgi:hypothetical protein
MLDLTIGSKQVAFPQRVTKLTFYPLSDKFGGVVFRKKLFVLKQFLQIYFDKRPGSLLF